MTVRARQADSPIPAKSRPKQNGPQTTAGKNKSKMNAVTHGSRAADGVLPFEDPDEYAQSIADIVESLNPVGAAQKVIARQAAVALRRLGRSERWEAARARLTAAADPDRLAARLKAADGEIAELTGQRAALQRDPAADPPLLVRLRTMADAAPIDALLVNDVYEEWAGLLPNPEAAPGLGEICQQLGLSEDAVSEPLDWAGWDAGLVRRFLTEYLPAVGLTVDEFLDEAETAWRADLQDERVKRRQERAKLKAKIRAVELRKEDLIVEQAAPEALRLDLLGRYEASAMRMLDKMLKNLRTLQATGRKRGRSAGKDADED